MVDITFYNIISTLKTGVIYFNVVFPMTKKSHFRLKNNLSVKLSNDSVIAIPVDFEFDGSSSPRFLWWLFPSYGDFLFASLIHDYLYQIDYMREDIGVKEAQKFADKEMLFWSNRVNNKHIGKIIDNYLRYYAVRLFGRKLYIK